MASFMEQRTIFQLLNEVPDEREIVKDASSDEENIIEDCTNNLSDDKDYSSELEATSDCEEYFLTNDRDEYFSSKNEEIKWRKFQYNNSDKMHTQELMSSAIKVTSEIDAFLKLIDDKMLDNIVVSTNRKIERKKNQYKRDRDVQNLTKNELLALFGLLFLIGVNKGNHTSTEELWTTDGTGITMVRACMSKKRFLFLLRNLRFDNDEMRRKRRIFDKLAPIRYFLDSFITNCKSSYSVGQYVSVKSLEVFQGQLNSSQNLSKNLAKCGLKIFALCDAKTYFTNNLEVYCGEQPDGPYRLSNDPIDIVERLVAPIEGSNRNLTIGTWYTCSTLAKSLLEKKITCIGSMRRERSEIPVEFLPNKYKRVGTSMFGYQPDMTLVSFVPRTNRSIILLSTMKNCNIVDEKTKKPLVALYYDMTKGAVDVVHELCKAYFVARVTNQWPLALFFTLTNIASVNAQILYEANNVDCRVIRKTFLKNLSLSLMRNHLCERAKILTLPTEIRAILARYREEPIEIQKENEESRKRGRCHLCARAKNVDTTIKCKFCRRFSCKGHVETVATCIECKSAKNEEM
ncbi:uncharacterized protein LOC122502151 [Leptopilina heterotoma]|uniref:uncharacterized protein LOC122502151 n=1 Tax=Leptopilina heterotoma TaxID=63436 RepID=UPI001CAA06B4|nr:uncharacterized protein LOC122502151 [Leptopilina heterotoma]